MTRNSYSEIPEPGFHLAPGGRLLPLTALQESTRIQEAGDDEACFRLYREIADLPVIARFTIEGEPASKSRARFTKRGSKVFAYTPEKTKVAEERVAALFKSAAPEHVADTDLTYGVMALFFCGMRQRRDTDNMLKLILDGLNKIAWGDDSQVVEVSGRKTLVSPGDARTDVVIYTVGKIQYFTGTCGQCGDEFVTYPSWANPIRLKKFCSQECSVAWKRDKSLRTCAHCGGKFYQNDRPKSKYCSRECSAPKVMVDCFTCGKEFGRAKSYVRARNFCSATCRDASKGGV